MSSTVPNPLHSTTLTQSLHNNQERGSTEPTFHPQQDHEEGDGLFEPDVDLCFSHESLAMPILNNNASSHVMAEPGHDSSFGSMLNFDSTTHPGPTLPSNPLISTPSTKIQLRRTDFMSKYTSWETLKAKVADKVGLEENTYIWWYRVVTKEDDETAIEEEKAFNSDAFANCKQMYRQRGSAGRIVVVWRHDMTDEST
ncbi:hypothetical protein K431DRAFT_48085 [Polychaeton citri CBS 116435]|uniref:Uncharacterized protein n=1 Tax=Polychaeton citri CBS 116435 TaxID=1314669 RepID=A0A9P4PXH0_9PEZI|nr:hypothetical protein K431DRAFT_48085 [Polychaeton citri CBS 116435]